MSLLHYLSRELGEATRSHRLLRRAYTPSSEREARPKAAAQNSRSIDGENSRCGCRSCSRNLCNIINVVICLPNYRNHFETPKTSMALAGLCISRSGIDIALVSAQNGALQDSASKRLEQIDPIASDADALVAPFTSLTSQHPAELTVLAISTQVFVADMYDVLPKIGLTTDGRFTIDYIGACVAGLRVDEVASAPCLLFVEIMSTIFIAQLVIISVSVFLSMLKPQPLRLRPHCPLSSIRSSRGLRATTTNYSNAFSSIHLRIGRRYHPADHPRPILSYYHCRWAPVCEIRSILCIPQSRRSTPTQRRRRYGPVCRSEPDFLRGEQRSSHAHHPSFRTPPCRSRYHGHDNKRGSDEYRCRVCVWNARCTPG